MVTEANDAVSSKLSTTAVLSPTTSSSSGGALIISITGAMRSFLTASSTDLHLSEDLRHLSSSLILQSTAPYQSLKTIWFGSEFGSRPDLSSLLAGSNFIFASPTPRQKSEELKARLRQLEEAAERKAYDELVKDITPRKPVNEPFSSYKDQLGFGLHVVVTMFTGYLVGYAAFRALFGQSPPMSAAGGILGLVGAMLVETLLFILRSSDLGGESSSSSTSRPSNLKIKKNQ
ncbi:uncharacterized protein LOC131001076 [Salvia miltiorrhiza]|uniref:uncharacterized protein LOC131001076 n=1 Tax=Salvia miltiorrhiza TaxID=226208 RepID=UPI0025ACB1F9|nr:uncharacterized protein LOC131001076 [Salvia miltiorrhiza]XP_057783249.1 uncharacterized protein LOC131001076 [Salvia miltiorrhiza]XP_057783250.1 uncharacterized protein LOC131001076 [Salvia miltiorrhiza]XP_057783251.1 uncharacterized protein LOC131001076 [Salvia miltiorrhiza]XP_057783252.1 uncharacterized protein LOC131001076 [Salvia miltiorrhiza]